jgi:hypothetical protein
MDEGTSGISRRTALKRIGAGAAIAWTAPVLMSVDSAAFAASPACTNCDLTCPRKQNQCSPGCFCFTGQDNICDCIFARLCPNVPGGVALCGPGLPACPAGEICIHDCCAGGNTSTQLSCGLPCSAKPGATPATTTAYMHQDGLVY